MEGLDLGGRWVAPFLDEPGPRRVEGEDRRPARTATQEPRPLEAGGRYGEKGAEMGGPVRRRDGRRGHFLRYPALDEVERTARAERGRGRRAPVGDLDVRGPRRGEPALHRGRHGGEVEELLDATRRADLPERLRRQAWPDRPRAAAASGHQDRPAVPARADEVRAAAAVVFPARELREDPERSAVVDGDERSRARRARATRGEGGRGRRPSQPQDRVPPSRDRPAEVGPGPARSPVRGDGRRQPRGNGELLPARPAVGAEEEAERLPRQRPGRVGAGRHRRSGGPRPLRGVRRRR